LQAHHRSLRAAVRRIIAAKLIGLVVASMGYAAGTPAGTMLMTQATASFRDSRHTNLQFVGSNTVNVVIGQIAVVNITPTVATQIARVNSSADYAFRVVNSGNGTDEFGIAVMSSLNFPIAMYRDANRDGVLAPDEVAAGALLLTGSMPADSTAYLVARVTVPNTASMNGQSDLLSITAVSGFDPRRSATALYTTTISSALIAATKSVDVTSPRAGDRVVYTVTCTNTGTADAANVTITDVLDVNLHFLTGSASPTPVSISGQTVIWEIGTLAGKETRTITYTATLLNNVPPTTEIHNFAILRCLDGTTAQQDSSAEINFIVVRSGGVVTVDATQDQETSAEPGDTVQYAFTITNNGVQPETFNLNSASSRNIAWILYADENANGRVDAGESVVTTTGPVPGGGGEFRVIALARMPRVPADLTVDIVTLRVASTVNPDNFITRLGSTTIMMPMVTLLKEVTAPMPVPGNEITYTISYANRGHGSAYRFLLVDGIPAHTTYVAGSTRHNGAGRTDSQDADEITVENGAVTAMLGTLSPATSGTIEFKVRIE
jgi:uncharacterized repeat protein (TIGR01451 family)